MAVPKTVKCRLCGGWSGKYRFVESGELPPLDQHTHLEDCVRELANRVEELERELNLQLEEEGGEQE